MNWKTTVVLILLGSLVVFVAQNYEVVEIKFLLWAFKASRALVLFFTLLIGILIGWILSHLKKE
jgi:uncharacterized integral membrane protein